MRHSWKEGSKYRLGLRPKTTTNLELLNSPDSVGGWPVQAPDDLQGRLPDQPAQVQVRAAAVPPERVPVRDGLSVAAGRGEGLAPGHHHQADPARHPGPAERAQHQGPGPGGGLHYLLVSLVENLFEMKLLTRNSFQSKPSRVREARPSTGQSHGSHGID